jgi:hypothetical protein
VVAAVAAPVRLASKRDITLDALLQVLVPARSSDARASIASVVA